MAARSRGASAPLRIVQVGLGGWGRDWYRRRLLGFPDVRVVASVDQSADALAVARDEFGLRPDRCFATLEEALAALASGDAADAPQAVLVTASLPGHVPAARTALAAGLHVLMEKPFAPSVAEARELVREAAAVDRILMISQNYRYFPAPVRAAEIVGSGELGRLGVVHIDFRRDHVSYDEKRERHYNLPHPLLADMAIHHFDLMRMVTGADARRVRCHSFNPPWSHFKDHPAAEAVIEMEHDVVVTYRGSWVSHGPVTPWAGEWRMEFDRGEVAFESRGDENGEHDTMTVKRIGEKRKQIRLPKIGAADRTGSLTEFVACVRDGSVPQSAGAANVGSIGLTYAAIEAAACGGWVAVEH